MTPIRSITLGTALLLGAAVPSSGAYVLDGITGGTFGASSTDITGSTASVTLFNTPISIADRESAIRFQTGAHPSTLEELEFHITVRDFTDLAPIHVTLSTGASAPGGTGTVNLGSVVPPSTTNFNQTLGLNGNSTPLAPNTEYWLHFTTNGTDANYSLATSNLLNTTGNWAVTDVAYTHPPATPWTSINGIHPAIRLDVVETVPEPAPLLLGSLGLMMLFKRRRPNLPTSATSR